jgi:hypothetical protein
MTARAPVVLTEPIDARVAASLLNRWGFVIQPDLPDTAGDAYLLVAMRQAPELDHFDPERIELWVTNGSRSDKLEITRDSRPFDGEYSWGVITIEDRLGVTNEYVSTGGHLAVRDVEGTTVAIFSSSAPILRRGGHSQGWDAAAVDLAAWFARVMVAVDFEPGFEARLAAATPLARYAAFIADATRRHGPSPALRGVHGTLWPLLCAEQSRLRLEHWDDWADGLALLDAAHLNGSAPAVATEPRP